MERVLKAVIEKHIIEQGDRVLAGVSGGADSVCLFFLLLELKKQVDFEIMAVHVNHQIRGAEAEADQKYVEKICRENHVPVRIVTKDVRVMAEKEKLSEEEAGRKARYQAFEQILKEWNGNKIALAHHKNDQAETVLWNLVRGSGLRGMTGMKEQRECYIRPLLSVTRTEIEDYLKKRNISYQTDSTNQTLEYTRNKIRLKVMPYITEELNGRAVEHIANTAEIFGEIQDFIDKTAEQKWNRVVKKQGTGYLLEDKVFLAEHVVIQKAILQKVLSDCANGLKDITNEHIVILQRLFLREVGKQVQLPRGVKACKTYHGVEVISVNTGAKPISVNDTAVNCETESMPAKDTAGNQAAFADNQGRTRTEVSAQLPKKKEFLIAIPGITELESSQLLIECNIINRDAFDKIMMKMENDSEKNIINSKNYCTKWFDYDKIGSMVLLRNYRKGDTLQIGKNGEHKKLNRFFIDKKIPREERGEIWLFAEGQEVIWVPDYRISEGYRVTDRTEHILQITMKTKKR